MSKIMCNFRGQKVAKTLIFYTHSIAEQKKSPMAILRGATERSIRYFCMDLPLNRIVF